MRRSPCSAKCSAIKPDDDHTHYSLGGVLREQGKLDEAVAEYREAIRLLPDYFSTHNDLGLALYLAGKRDEAIAEYREAIRLLPDFRIAHRNLGQALFQQGKVDEALPSTARPSASIPATLTSTTTWPGSWLFVPIARGANTMKHWSTPSRPSSWTAERKHC